MAQFSLLCLQADPTQSKTCENLPRSANELVVALAVDENVIQINLTNCVNKAYQHTGNHLFLKVRRCALRAERQTGKLV